jgi:hypothetical protein
MSSYSLWQYFHILLFVYWLGADLGVFLASRYVARADLPTPERLRFLELLLKADMGPRSALILMVPIGFTLAIPLGLTPFAAGLMPAIWVFAVLWLALTWRLFLIGRDPRAQTLAKLDHWIRVTVAALFVSLGLLSLVQGGPVGAGWLSLKMLLFAIVVIIGLLLRRIIRDWAQGFTVLNNVETSTTARDDANTLIFSAYRRATRLAHSLWLLVAVIALLGVSKPAWI